MFKKITKNKDIRSCWFWHKWKVLKDTGFTKYKECNKCGSRCVEQERYGYQPINFEWLNYLTNIE